MTIREATNLWVNRDMSAIPLSVAEKLAKCSDYNDLMEITPPAINDRVYVFDNGEYGEITNYDALMDKEIAKYNAAIEKAGTNQKAQEKAEKAYDLFIKALENYEETYSAYLDKLATIQDLQNEKINKELQNIQDRLDTKLDLEAD